MEIITDISSPLKLNHPVITIGTFDGVHQGHRVILNEVVEIASHNQADSALVTFHPHPRIVLRQPVSLLNTRDEKRDIMSRMGISHMIEVPFTTEFADMEAGSFIDLLYKTIKPSAIVIGYDHGFGRNRSGDVKQLEEAGQQYGFKVINIQAIQAEHQKVSSSVIRELLMQGSVKQATKLLGQPYQISGVVVRGNQIGKRIGYPTANLLIEDINKLIPAIGVYASSVTYKNRDFYGMTNIGLRPTVNAHQLTIETNIFDFDEDIYYERLTVNLIDRLRSEIKFGNLDILRHQLKKDKIAALKIIKSLD